MTPLEKLLKTVLFAAADELANIAEQMVSDGTAELNRIAGDQARRNPTPAPKRQAADSARAKRRAAQKQTNAPPLPKKYTAADAVNAAYILSELSGIPARDIANDEARRKEAHRIAARKTHPDNGGTDAILFAQVTWAKEVLSIK